MKEETMSNPGRPLMEDHPSGWLNEREPHLPYDNYLSKRIQAWIEQRYCAKIDAHGRLEELLKDASFKQNPLGHSSLFADHGVIHARDVTIQTLQVLEQVNGVLIPHRDETRLQFMKGYGVQLAYIHDIGLCDLSSFGRKMHAYSVAQLALSPEFDVLLDAIWDENAGNVPWRLTKLSSLEQDPRLVLRELLALAICHSKSAIPVALLNAPQELRRAIQRCAVIDLKAFYDRILEPRSKDTQSSKDDETSFLLGFAGSDTPVSPERTACLDHYYGDFAREGFRWLLAEPPLIREFVQDVVDTLRAVRCADALRQRGTTLKTSGNYEIFVDQHTGHAIYALRQMDQKLLLLEIPDPISAGEANLASCELTQDGDLRASFHRGAFADLEVIQRAASNAALVLDDIQRDVIESFQRVAHSEDHRKDWQKDSKEMQILLECVEDNPEFTSFVKMQLQQLHPVLQNSVRVVPSLKNVSARERHFYLEGIELEWDDEEKYDFLERMARSGHKTSSINPELAYQDVKWIKLRIGQILIDAGDPPGFVYIPLTGGLKIIPLGGYPSFQIQPWMPLGITGVIRGAVRNATVVADEDATLLMIPQAIYLKHWHQTFSVDEFLEWIQGEIGLQNPQAGSEDSPGNSHQVTPQDKPRQAKL